MSMMDPFSPASLGMPAALGSGQRAASAAHNPVNTIVRGAPNPLHPDNAMFWMGLLLAATMGCIGATVTGRVGPAHASAGIGKT